MVVDQLKPGMFVVVKFLVKKSVKHFVGKLTQFYWDSFEVSYLTTDRGKSFYFPEAPDEALVNVQESLYIINPPYNEKRSKFTFPDKNVKFVFEVWSL